PACQTYRTGPTAPPHAVVTPVRTYRAAAAPHGFFSSWIADHRDLHSFPTRRSSDLPAARRALSRSGHFRRRAVGNDARVRLGFRSEEHTSELQSRGHLVCRLLLEKKNTEIASLLLG